MGKIHQSRAISQPDNQSPKGRVFFQKGICYLGTETGRTVKTWPRPPDTVSRMSEQEESCLGLRVEAGDLTGKRRFPHVCMDVNSRGSRVSGLLSVSTIRLGQAVHVAQQLRRPLPMAWPSEGQQCSAEGASLGAERMVDAMGSGLVIENSLELQDQMPGLELPFCDLWDLP